MSSTGMDSRLSVRTSFAVFPGRILWYTTNLFKALHRNAVGELGLPQRQRGMEESTRCSSGISAKAPPIGFVGYMVWSIFNHFFQDVAQFLPPTWEFRNKRTVVGLDHPQRHGGCFSTTSGLKRDSDSSSEAQWKVLLLQPYRKKRLVIDKAR